MRKPPSRSAVDATTARLRDIIIAAENGAFLGSEEALIGTLGAARSTVRQAARLLEREGLLRVRRGPNGGYFASRPDVRTIEATVSAYLQTQDMEKKDVTVVASVLWIEVIRKAADLNSPDAKRLAARLIEHIRALPADMCFDDVVDAEEEIRGAIFNLVKSRYIQLIFQINAAFARRAFPVSDAIEDISAQRTFVRAWRRAKTAELEAIADGDVPLAVMAAGHSRNLWHRRLWADGELPSADA